MLELAPGTVVSHYRIERQLGRGGMGVVYLADDLTLGRKVALKFLPEEHTRDDAALSRFQREARAASALNHPSICTIYEIGQHENRPFIAMERLQGQSLRDLLSSGRVPGERLLQLASEIADALDAAHSAGVIHRDIKPGNIFVTARGDAKLLDFGLATLDPATSEGASALSTTPGEAQLTSPGTTVGTVAYMSPEQMRGERVDSRSDLFSFGVVLYEMATGTRPFRGSTSAVISHEILSGTPARPQALNPELSPDLDRLIVKAIEKERALRYQSAAEMRADINRMRRDHSSSSDAQVAAALARRHQGAMMAAAVVLVLAIAGGIYLARSRGTPPSPVTALAPPAYEIEQLTTSGNAFTPAISPDGRFVVYAQADSESTSLRIRHIATGSNTEVVPAEPGVFVGFPTVTPDGGFVDFIRSDVSLRRTLLRVPLLGGTPRRIVENITSPVGWSPDGQQMAFIRAGGDQSALVVADADGGRERVLATRNVPAYFLAINIVGRPPVRPAWSPDGKHIALYEFGDFDPRVVVIEVATSAAISRDARAGFQPRGLGWLGPASLVLSQPQEEGQRIQLWRMSYPDGAVSPLTNDLNSYIGVALDGTRGSLVTSRAETRTALWVGDAAGTRGGEIVPPTLFTGRFTWVSWAGPRVMYNTTASGRAAVVAVRPEGGGPEDLGQTAPNLLSGAATSDGGTLVFARRSDGLWKTDGAGLSPVQLTPYAAFDVRVTPDDRHVVFLSPRNGVESPWIIPVAGGEPSEIVRQPAAWGSLDISPDSRRLIFVFRETLVVCDLPACANRRNVPIPANFGRQPRWTPDGQRVAYIEANGANLWSIPVNGGPPKAFTRFTDTAPGRAIDAFAWSRDGQRLAIVRATTTNDIVLFRGLQP